MAIRFTLETIFDLLACPKERGLPPPYKPKEGTIEASFSDTQYFEALDYLKRPSNLAQGETIERKVFYDGERIWVVRAKKPEAAPVAS